MKNEPFHILLADDDETDRMLFVEAFSELKINTIVRTFNDGIHLMEWLKRHRIHGPHFLFLDLNMPLKNGLECLKEIKENENLKELFIAIYSTSYSEKDMDETFQLGANIYITKPNNFNTLKHVLDMAIHTADLYQDKSMNRDNFLMKI